MPFVWKKPSFFGSNGFCDVEFWQPNYPSDIKSIVQSKSAIQVIRDLVMEVSHHGHDLQEMKKIYILYF